jgi:hypothetical protein
MNPEDGKTLEHFVVIVVDAVPLLYVAPVETGRGMTVAVLKMTTGPELEAAAWFSLPGEPAAEATAPELALATAGVAVSV